MRFNWKKLVAQTVFWLVAETLLNFVGIDGLADYSEFVFQNNSVISPLESKEKILYF